VTVDDAGIAEHASAIRVVGVVIAGGQSRRMGSDKGQRLLAGRSLAAHALDRLRGQVEQVIVNANGEAATYAALGVPVVADTIAGHLGPLAGMLAGLRWAADNASGTTHIATVPVDVPLFPHDLVGRLAEAIGPGTRVCFVETSRGPQPVFALIEIGLADALDRAIRTGARGVIAWLLSQPHAAVRFETDAAFTNVNTPDDLSRVEALLRQ